MIELARQYGRYGYRRIAALLREAGWSVSDGRIERLWRREGLKVPVKQPKNGRLWLNDGSCVRLRPEHRNRMHDPSFRNGREFAAWLGLTPANKSSGGKEKLGRITKMGDQYLRQLLVVGMTSLVRQTRSHPERANKWLTSLLERKPARVATVAMANKTARIVWAVLTRNEPYSPRAAA